MGTGMWEVKDVERDLKGDEWKWTVGTGNGNSEAESGSGGWEVGDGKCGVGGEGGLGGGGWEVGGRLK